MTRYAAEFYDYPKQACMDWWNHGKAESGKKNPSPVRALYISSSIENRQRGRLQSRGRSYGILKITSLKQRPTLKYVMLSRLVSACRIT